jgi:hypothetical protein
MVSELEPDQNCRWTVRSSSSGENFISTCDATVFLLKCCLSGRGCVERNSVLSCGGHSEEELVHSVKRERKTCSAELHHGYGEVPLAILTALCQNPASGRLFQSPFGLRVCWGGLRFNWWWLGACSWWFWAGGSSGRCGETRVSHSQCHTQPKVTFWKASALHLDFNIAALGMLVIAIPMVGSEHPNSQWSARFHLVRVFRHTPLTSMSASLSFLDSLDCFFVNSETIGWVAIAFWVRLCNLSLFYSSDCL